MDITFKNVSFTYQLNTPFAHQALQDISFHIPSGSFVAIIGHTGSGKSTLIQHLNGLTLPTKGEVIVGDYHLSKEKKPKDMKRLRSKVGVVFQYPEHQLFEETVERDIYFGPENFGVSKEDIQKRVKDILPRVGLTEELLARSPFELSGGQMRRVAIAGVLATNPDILVLDEPTAGLDPRGQKEIMNMFKEMHIEKNLTTVLVTHDMEDALAYADHIIVLNKGKKYIEGKPEEILIEKEMLQQVQLDQPEVIEFLQAFNKKFNCNITFKRQSIKEIAASIKEELEGAKVK